MSDKVFERINTSLVLLITIIILYPLIFVLSASISDPAAITLGKMWLWPVDITFEGYKRVFANRLIWTGYKNTIIYTTLGTLLHLFILLPGAYALSRKELLGKKFVLWFVLFTMLFNGGIIPTFIVVRELNMVNTMWAIIIPGVIGAWAILVAKSFFEQNIPDQLVEAAKIDGASDIYLFFRIVLPLSLPIIAVMALFHAVAVWNQYLNALIYLRDDALYPLQLVLRNILIVSQLAATSTIGISQSFNEQLKAAELVKYAVIIVSALPLLVVYPFLQRFFIQGVLIGSVKE
ncbi:MAG TPA: carbohydrate ABC transporter permease [Pseudogracilibacillus sp.]|nr:carbohydrate ABC transporter permease [Pseudogracilibacillus sp.]